MSTVMYSGKEDRNSSKVLAPPGGKTHNIFGGMDDSEPAPQPQRRQQPPPSQPSPSQQASPHQGPARSYKPAPNTFNLITGEPITPNQQRAQPQQQQQQQQQQQPAARPQQLQPSPQSQQQPPRQQPARTGGDGGHTSIKIHNPPGGRSSITF